MTPLRSIALCIGAFVLAVQLASAQSSPGDECICELIYAPVCGENGKTYGNACQAACDGVAVMQVGLCPKSPPPPPARPLPNQVKCARDDPGVRCLRNPCQGATCPGYPNAVCIAGYCRGPRPFLGITSGGACSANWADPVTRRGVYCTAQAPPPAPELGQARTEAESAPPASVTFPNQVTCAADDPGVRCLRNPCAGATCAGQPDAHCIPNFCRGPRDFLGITTGPACTPVFADSTTGQGLQCGNQPPSPTPGSP